LFVLWGIAAASFCVASNLATKASPVFSAADSRRCAGPLTVERELVFATVATRGGVLLIFAVVERPLEEREEREFFRVAMVIFLS
jgi:hypothetical protein